jgi:hypothetical protein
MKKLIAILAILFAFTVSAEAKTFQYLKGVKFIIPDEEYTIVYNGRAYGQQTFHYSAMSRAIRFARTYFKTLDEKFDINNYYITIEVDDTLNQNLFGYYDWEMIRVQSFAYTHGGGFTLYGRTLSYLEYVALLMHEIAHVILHQRSAYKDRAGHEYFAYNVMFDIAGYELVSHATKAFPKSRTGLDKHRISTDYLDLDPPNFAIRAYYHRAQDGGKTFKLIWSGKFKSFKRPGPE